MSERNFRWQTKAACRDLDTAIFFPDGESEHDIAPALVVCDSCPVRAACLEFALTTRQDDGVWGGTTGTERKRLRRRRARERSKAA